MLCNLIDEKIKLLDDKQKTHDKFTIQLHDFCCNGDEAQPLHVPLRNDPRPDLQKILLKM